MPVNYAATVGTIGRSGAQPPVPPKGDMMSEMARKLQERKAKSETVKVGEQQSQQCHTIWQFAIIVIQEANNTMYA